LPFLPDKVTLLPLLDVYMINMLEPDIWEPVPMPTHDNEVGPVICRNTSFPEEDDASGIFKLKQALDMGHCLLTGDAACTTAPVHDRISLNSRKKDYSFMYCEILDLPRATRELKTRIFMITCSQPWQSSHSVRRSCNMT
jgi:hypothetical protein